jgi:hypothetical protein
MPLTFAPLAALILAAAGADLERGIQLFNNFEDAKAEAVLRAFAATSPPPSAEQLGKAHLYLGLIAFQALDSDKARAEFAFAVRVAPAIEVPYGVSPKARLLFEQVQRETIEQEARTKAARPPPQRAAEVPPAPPESPSRVPAYLLGGIGLAGVAAGCIVGAIAASDLSASKNLATPVDVAAAKNSSAGTEGLTADILFAAGGTLAAIGVVLWFVEAPHDVQAAVTPLPSGGAAMLVSGSF